jgi:hypothetical protein
MWTRDVFISLATSFLTNHLFRFRANLLPHFNHLNTLNTSSKFLLLAFALMVLMTLRVLCKLGLLVFLQVLSRHHQALVHTEITSITPWAKQAMPRAMQTRLLGHTAALLGRTVVL